MRSLAGLLHRGKVLLPETLKSCTFEFYDPFRIFIPLKRKETSRIEQVYLDAEDVQCRVPGHHNVADSDYIALVYPRTCS